MPSSPPYRSIPGTFSVIACAHERGLTFGGNRDFYNRPAAIPAAHDYASVALPIRSFDIASGFTVAPAMQKHRVVVIMVAAARTTPDCHDIVQILSIHQITHLYLSSNQCSLNHWLGAFDPTLSM